MPENHTADRRLSNYVTIVTFYQKNSSNPILRLSTSIPRISLANYEVNRSEFRTLAFRSSGIPCVFRNRGIPRTLEESELFDPVILTGAIIQGRKEPAGDLSAEKRISRYPDVLLVCWWDEQKAWPSRCLGRSRCRSTPPPFVAGETKCIAERRRKKKDSAVVRSIGTNDGIRCESRLFKSMG